MKKFGDHLQRLPPLDDAGQVFLVGDYNVDFSVPRNSGEEEVVAMVGQLLEPLVITYLDSFSYILSYIYIYFFLGGFSKNL